MYGQFIVGVFLGILAALLINVGKAVQKQNVQVFLHGRGAFRQPHRRYLYGWLVGLAMTASAMIPFSLALKLTESPSIVSSMTGVGLIGLAVYAILVIGERFERLDLAGVALVVVGTSVLSYMGAGEPIDGRRVLGLGMLPAIGSMPVLCAVACIASFRWKRIWGPAWGVTSGVSLGIALILGDTALMEADGDFFGQLRNPYPYIAIASSIPAVVCTQVGFLKARALDVVPAVNSSVILTPLLLERLMYGATPGLFRLTVIAMIVVGVVFLSMSTGARASEAPAATTGDALEAFDVDDAPVAKSGGGASGSAGLS